MIGRIDLQGNLQIANVALRAGNGSALSLASGAALLLESSLLEGDGPPALIDATSAQVTGHRLFLRSPAARAFEGRGGVTLSLTDSVVAAGGGLTYSLERQTLALEAVVVEKSSVSGLSIAGMLALRRTLFDANAGFSVETLSGLASMEDVVVRDGGGSRCRAPPLRSRGS